MYYTLASFKYLSADTLKTVAFRRQHVAVNKQLHCYVQ
jgi:hypothetical protein